MLRFGGWSGSWGYYSVDIEVVVDGTEVAAEVDTVELEGVEASQLDSPLLAAKQQVFGGVQLKEEEE